MTKKKKTNQQQPQQFTSVYLWFFFYPNKIGKLLVFCRKWLLLLFYSSTVENLKIKY